MTTDDYILLVYKNLKREISSSEFDLLNEQTIQDDSFAKLRDEIEDTWDITGDVPEISTSEEINSSFDRLLNKKKKELQEKSIEPVLKKEAKIVGFRKYQKYIAGIAAILILSLSMWWFSQDSNNLFEGGTNGLALTLEDQSSIFLAANSTLEVKSFGKTREMTLKGKAEFSVAHDASRPFIVYTQASKTEVLGTKFVIHEADKISKIILQVIEGKVRFSNSNSDQEKIVIKDETAVLEKNQISKRARLNNLKAESISILRYEEENLQNVIDEIMIIFNEEVIIENSTLKDCILSGVIPAKSTDTVLKYIATQFDLEIENSDQKWILRGGNCQ